MNKPPMTYSQKLTIVVGMLGFVLLLVIMQLWLLMATMNAFLAHDDSIVWPAAWASLACFGLTLGLLINLYRIEK
ncbi:MAG: hypothetical protein K0Q50_2551 [Vampirovibrio sp.]|nr:hypothetical protein [Vampirovibrio sp.]